MNADLVNAPPDLQFPSENELSEAVTAKSLDIDPLAIVAYNELMRTGRFLTVLLDNQFSSSGTSVARSAAMWFISQATDKKGVTPAEIAEGLHVTRATVTVLLRALETSKLISKRRSATDGRQFHIKLTAAGRRLLEATWPQQGAVVSEVMGDLSKQEKQAIVSITSKVRARIAQMNEVKAAAKSDIES